MRVRVVRRLGALASMLAVLGASMAVLVITTAPAGAVSVTTEAEFRAAWENTSVRQIDLTADVLMNCSNDTWVRNGPNGDEVTVDGHGFSLDGNSCNAQVLLSGAQSPGLVTLKNVTVKGGRYDCHCAHGGGGIQANDDLVLVNSAVINNLVVVEAAGGNTDTAFAAGIYAGGDVTLTNSTVSGNLAKCFAICALAHAGGIQAGTLVATNSTISNNTADENGFGVSDDSAGGIAASSITLTYSTVADNTASISANVRVNGAVGMTVFASVVANAAGGGANCTLNGTTTTSSGYNYERTGSSSCGFGGGTGDLVQADDPLLGALGTNGGGVGQTRMPSSSSPLIEQIPPSACDDAGASTIVPLVDERGSPRPRGSGCDIGAAEAPAGSFTPITPTRILDTRIDLGLTDAFTPGQTRDLQVAGITGVPSNASAVLLNVTATAASKAGWLTLFPADASLPTASNVNFSAGQTIPNLVVVKAGFGGGGLIKINNSSGNPQAGTVEVIADVMGYYRDATAGIADGFNGLTPTRILDTRNGTGLSGVFAAQQTRQLTVGGVAGVPADADAVVLNVTATSPTKAGWLTIFPADASLPTASNLNFVAGQTVPNLVTVKLGVGGADEDKVSINNSGGNLNAGTVHVVADVVGYYRTPAGGSLVAIAPQRVLDTRNGTGGVTGPVAAQGTITVDPQTASGFAAVGAYAAVVVNVTVTAPGKAGWLTVFPSDASLPTASNLNFVAGQTVPNLVKINVGPDGKFKINNTGGGVNPGTVQIVVDIVGYYTPFTSF